MKLQSNIIYQVKPFRDAFLCPTLSIKGEAQVYVSLSLTKPESIDDMFESTEFEMDKCNTVVGMIRWIAVVFDDGNVVEECGLVESPFGGKNE